MTVFQYFLRSVCLFFLVNNVALASHTLNPACANVVLDPTGLGGTTETFDGCELVGADTPLVGVILMHGRTASPQGPVVNELRASLNAAGYTTLSIENPAANPVTDVREFSDYITDVVGVNYAFPEAYARVRAAINYLQTQGVTQVVLVGFSMGSRFATATVARIGTPSLPIIGLIGVGMYNTSNVDPLDHDFTLDAVSVPVLDIFGDDDINATTDRLGRVTVYSTGAGVSYTQVQLDCAVSLSTNDCHKLVGLKGSSSSLLETVVNNWVACNAPLSVADCSNTYDLTWNGVLLGPVAMPGTTGGSGSSGGGGGSMGGMLLGMLAFFVFLRQKKHLFSYKIIKYKQVSSSEIESKVD